MQWHALWHDDRRRDKVTEAGESVKVERFWLFFALVDLSEGGREREDEMTGNARIYDKGTAIRLCGVCGAN